MQWPKIAARVLSAAKHFDRSSDLSLMDMCFLAIKSLRACGIIDYHVECIDEGASAVREDLLRLIRLFPDDMENSVLVSIWHVI